MGDADRERIETVLRACEYKPFRQHSEISEEELLEYCLGIFKNLESGEKIFWGKDKAVGLFEFLPWDSDLFGTKMAKVSIFISAGEYRHEKECVLDLLDQIIYYSKEKHISHLSVKVDPKEMSCIHAMEERGFYLSGTTVVYALDLGRFDPGEYEKLFEIRPSCESDIEKLLLIARTSFSNPDDWFDRFHADPYLSEEKSDELYVRWIENCCRGKEADMVFVADIDGNPVGFITAKLEKHANKIFSKTFASIPLNAVDTSYRKQGVYRSLVLEILDWLKGKTDIVTINTQLTSIAVHRTWRRLGAYPVSFKHIFHRLVLDG